MTKKYVATSRMFETSKFSCDFIFRYRLEYVRTMVQKKKKKNRDVLPVLRARGMDMSECTYAHGGSAINYFYVIRKDSHTRLERRRRCDGSNTSRTPRGLVRYYVVWYICAQYEQFHKN